MTQAKKETSTVRIGQVYGDNHQDLGLNAIKHCGLAVSDSDLDDNIGKKCLFINDDKLKFSGYHGFFTIIGVQKMWGHDGDGNYVPHMIGYRVSKGENDFGYCALPKDIKILQPKMSKTEAYNHRKKKNA